MIGAEDVHHKFHVEMYCMYEVVVTAIMAVIVVLAFTRFKKGPGWG